ncbi:YIP1 family protein [Salinithrix halophila]|uniref:YIP1 family protein n=1 Tax=Salinithrix halophila TaxID=1485204 RepID=A0ABV8JCG0_9BACL
MSYLDEEQEINPWLSMWKSPRETVRNYVDSGHTKWLWLLAIFAGIKVFLDNAEAQNVGDQVSIGSILFLSLFFGTIMGIVQWWLLSGALTLVGNWLGMHAEWGELRKAVALSYVPLVWTFFIWIIKIFAFGQENFTPETPTIDASIPLLSLIVLCYLINYLVFFWFVVVLSKSVAEVYDTSAWTGFGLILLTAVILSVVFILLILPIVLLWY